MSKLRRPEGDDTPLTPTSTIPMLNTAAQFLISASSNISKGKSKEDDLVECNVEHALIILANMGFRLR